MYFRRILFALLALVLASSSRAAKPPPLVLETKVPLGDVPGRI
jgi:hypothetical protein